MRGIGSKLRCGLTIIIRPKKKDAVVYPPYKEPAKIADDEQISCSDDAAGEGDRVSVKKLIEQLHMRANFFSTLKDQPIGRDEYRESPHRS